jgi:pimeloyl-ACP methyl ester carboxylesterase
MASIHISNNLIQPPIQAARAILAGLGGPLLGVKHFSRHRDHARGPMPRTATPDHRADADHRCATRRLRMIMPGPHTTARISKNLVALAVAVTVLTGVPGLVRSADGSTVAASESKAMAAQTYPTLHKTIEVGGLQIFYREAGPKHAPTILLLHGFPTSSQMFRNLIPALADRFHVVAPDYPGFGNSSMPRVDDFKYTFDSLAEVMNRFVERLGLTKYSLYVMDYGAPVGYRLATRHPDRIQGLIVQNGNAYEEGLREFWQPFRAYWQERTEANAAALRKFLVLEATKWQYTHGVRNPEAISPDIWLVDQYLLDRPGNQEIQLELFYDYRSNLPLYPKWQAYFRQHQPPTLVVWGKNDPIFPAEGAHPYKRDLKNIEFHLLDTGHFALEEEGPRVAELIRRFFERQGVLGAR